MKTAVNLELLQQLRDEKAMSISDLAAVLGYKTPTGYWLLEKGQRKLSVDILYRLAKLYDVQMEDFILELD